MLGDGDMTGKSEDSRHLSLADTRTLLAQNISLLPASGEVTTVPGVDQLAQH